MGIWYTTLESVKSDLDFKSTARNDAQVRRAIEGASRSVETLTRRIFYPLLATRSFDWPSDRSPTSYRLWLEENEIISLTSVTSGDESISLSDVVLYPNDGPPYDRVELLRSSSASFGQGDDIQNDVALLALYGYQNEETNVAVTTSSLAVTGTSLDVDDSSLVGTGTVLRIDSERLVVTAKSMIDTTVNIGGDLTASKADQLVAVADGTAFAEDEVILVDAEKMLIVEIAGDNLVVTRAWDGSTLATHTTGADIYAPRRLTVSRAALGTTAASHASGATAVAWVVPGLVEELTAAEALNTLIQKSSAYSGSTGSGDSARRLSQSALQELRDRVAATYGRQQRTGVV